MLLWLQLQNHATFRRGVVAVFGSTIRVVAVILVTHTVFLVVVLVVCLLVWSGRLAGVVETKCSISEAGHSQ